MISVEYVGLTPLYIQGQEYLDWYTMKWAKNKTTNTTVRFLFTLQGFLFTLHSLTHCTSPARVSHILDGQVCMSSQSKAVGSGDIECTGNIHRRGRSVLNLDVLQCTTWKCTLKGSNFQVTYIAHTLCLSFLSILMGVDGLAEKSSAGTEQYNSTSTVKSGPTSSGLKKSKQASKTRGENQTSRQSVNLINLDV